MPDETTPPATAIMLPPLPDANTPAMQDKRLWLTGISILVAAANKKLGLDLGLEELGFIGALVGAYITQSQMGSVMKARAAGVAAAAAVTSPASVLGMLGGTSAKVLAFALVGALALGLPARAMAQEVPADAPVKYRVLEGTLKVEGMPVPVPVTTGYFLNDKSGEATAKEIADLRAQVGVYEQGGPSWLVTAGLVVLGMVAAGTTAWVLKPAPTPAPTP